MLSWNIYMLPFLSLFNNNGNRARNIADRLVDSDYNIIVFQEAFSSKCRNILAQRLKKNYPFQYGPANKCHLPFRTNSGLWVVSKIPLTKIDEIKFSISKGFDMVARKGAVLFKGEFEGAKFQLLTTHLQADGDHKIREKQCKEINEHLLEHEILGGYDLSEDYPELGNAMLVAVTEMNSREEIEQAFDDFNSGKFGNIPVA